MAEPATLYRFEIELSDIDRGVYESLAPRLARHPSEDAPRLVARALAYCLLYEEGLEFGRGVSTAEDPALWLKGQGDEILHWIDVGLPSAERMHRASKRAGRLSILCHKPLDLLAREASKRRIHEAGKARVLAVEPALIESLAGVLTRTPHWTVVKTGEDLHITAEESSFMGTVRERTLATLG